MIKDAVVICFSSIDWDFIWQGHQEVMATLSAQGNRVLFVENTGVRVPGVRDLPRLKRRFLNWWRSTKGFRQERENLFVYSPMILPFPYSRLARWLNRILIVRALRRWMQVVKSSRPIVWTFLPTPLIRDVMRTLEPEATVYYCTDDLPSSSPQAKRIARSERQLFREVDLVFVTSAKLKERAAQLTERVYLFPCGVDFEGFTRVRKAPDEVPSDLRVVPGPVVGYIGGVHQWVDQELLAAVAAKMPEVNFVLVGPRQIDVSALTRHQNVFLLGARSREEVPRYIKGFRVGIVPYRLSDYTAHVYPNKLNEYLAMGIPVVSTDLPEIRRFNAEHGGVVAIGQDAESFAKAIGDALEDRSAQTMWQRIEAAQQNDWAVRIEQMSGLIEERLTARRLAGMRWDESLRRLYRAASRRLLKAVLAAGIVYGILFYSPLIWWVAEPLRMAGVPRPSDAIVVLAGGVGESGKAGGGYQERVKQAVDLYRDGKASTMILVSGYQFVFQEAEVMRELAEAQGVPPSAILVETSAKNTVEDVIEVRDLLRRHGWQHILLVSSPYHMRRAVLTWRKLAPEIDVIPAPSLRSQFYLRGRGASLDQIWGIVHEYLGLIFYWLKGWV